MSTSQTPAPVGGTFVLRVKPTGETEIEPCGPKEMTAWPSESLAATLDRLKKGQAANGSLPHVRPPAEAEDAPLELKLLDLETGELA